MPRINSQRLLKQVQKVENKYKSVVKAPSADMMDVWRESGASVPENPDIVSVTRRTWMILDLSIERGLTVEEIAHVLKRRQADVAEMVHAYHDGTLKITKVGLKHG